MASSYETGCRCRHCYEGKPHLPIDKVERALARNGYTGVRRGICHGYRNGCRCKQCLAREAQKVNRPMVAQCQCAHPMGISQGQCFKCGKPMPRTVPRPARAAA